MESQKTYPPRGTTRSGDAPDTPRTRRRSQRQTGEGEASGGSDGGGAGDAEATTPRRSTRLTPRAGSEGEAGDESLEPSAKRQKRETDDGATGDGDGDGDGPGTGDDPSGAVGHAAANGDDGSNGGSGGGGNGDDGDEEEDDSVPQSPRKSTRRRAVSVKAAEAAEAAESDVRGVCFVLVPVWLLRVNAYDLPSRMGLTKRGFLAFCVLWPVVGVAKEEEKVLSKERNAEEG